MQATAGGSGAGGGSVGNGAPSRAPASNRVGDGEDLAKPVKKEAKPAMEKYLAREPNGEQGAGGILVGGVGAPLPSTALHATHAASCVVAVSNPLPETTPFTSGAGFYFMCRGTGALERFTLLHYLAKCHWPGVHACHCL